MVSNVKQKPVRTVHPIKEAFTMMINPGAVVKRSVAGISWPFSLAVSGLAFLFFFLQTGLDLYRTGQRTAGTVVLLSVEGLVLGTLGIALLAVIAWVITKMFKGDKPLSWAISAFGLGYCSTLIFALLGLFFGLVFNWNTSVAFGVSGVLWATGPMIVSIKEMSGEKTGLSILVATICSGLLLLGWALLGNA